MSKYLLIESRDPFDWADVARTHALATDLRRNGDEVTLFLVQNGVLGARRSARSEPLAALAQAGVKVLADEFSLRERGVERGRLAKGVEAAPLEVVVDQLAEGRKALFF